MIKNIYSLILKIIDDFKYGSLSNDSIVIFSQEGEELLLKRISDDKDFKFNLNNNKFYIDIGCNDHIRFSNTYYLWKKFNWTGINIDVNESMINKMKKIRNKDINLTGFLSSDSYEKEFTFFYEDVLSTSDAKKVNLVKSEGYEVSEIKKIPSIKFDELKSCIPKNNDIGFLNIDIESNEDAQKIIKLFFKNEIYPDLICCDFDNKTLNNIKNSKLIEIIQMQKYYFFAKLYNSAFFVKK